MAKLSSTLRSSLPLGFFFGVLVGVLSTRAASPTLSSAPEQTSSTPSATLKVQDVAASCGVYGLPGSPATVALTSGVEGRPVKAVVESDIFGGDDIEGCILTGLAGLPMKGDSLRVALPVMLPSDTSEALAAW